MALRSCLEAWLRTSWTKDRRVFHSFEHALRVQGPHVVATLDQSLAHRTTGEVGVEHKLHPGWARAYPGLFSSGAGAGMTEGESRCHSAGVRALAATLWSISSG